MGCQVAFGGPRLPPDKRLKGQRCLVSALCMDRLPLLKTTGVQTLQTLRQTFEAVDTVYDRAFRLKEAQNSQNFVGFVLYSRSAT